MIDIIITIIFMFFAIIFRKSKFIALLFFFFIWTLWGWNTWNGDYDAYENQYYSSIFNLFLSNYEKGYIFLNAVFLFFGISFQVFMKILSFVVLSIIGAFTIKFSKYPALFCVLFFIIFIMEYVFIRNFIVHSMLLLALFIVFKKVKYYKIWFITIILFASTIHITAIINLIFIFAFRSNNKIINIKIASLIFVLLILMSILFFRPILLPLMGNAYLEKFNYYKVDSGFSTVFFAHIGIIFLVYYYFKKILKCNSIPLDIRRIYIIVLNINIISLFYLCIYYHIPYFSRIIRFLFTFNLIFMLSAYYYNNNLKIKQRLRLIFFLIYFAVIVLFLKSTLSLTVYPLYKRNLIWGEEYYVPNFDYENKEEK